MWAGPVVVDEELSEHGLQMAVAEDENVIEQLSTCGPDPGSANEFATGLR
jgi:hypothetical protein